MHRWAFLLSILVPAAAAADVKVTPQIGYRAGGVDASTGVACLQPPCPAFAENEDDLVFGATVDFPLENGWEIELLLNHQPTRLEFSDAPGVPTNGIGQADFDVTHLHAGLLKAWKLSRFEPFVVLAAGQTRIESGGLASGGFIGGGFEFDRFSASLGTGVRMGLGDSERMGVRFEARGYWVDAPGALLDHEVLALRRDFTQVETTTGLSFKF